MFLLVDENEREIRRKKIPIYGTTTNNVAEFIGLINGLEELDRLGEKGVQVYMDSNLVVNCVNGTWKCKAPHLKMFCATAKGLLLETHAILDWLPNTENLVDQHPY